MSAAIAPSGSVDWSYIEGKPTVVEATDEQILAIVEKYNELYQELNGELISAARQEVVIYLFLTDEYEVIGNKLPHKDILLKCEPKYRLRITFTEGARNLIVDFVDPSLELIKGFSSPGKNLYPTHLWDFRSRLTGGLISSWGDYGVGTRYKKADVELFAKKIAKLCLLSFSKAETFPANVWLYLHGIDGYYYTINGYESINGFKKAKEVKSEKKVHSYSVYKILCQIHLNSETSSNPQIELYGVAGCDKLSEKLGAKIIEVLNSSSK